MQFTELLNNCQPKDGAVSLTVPPTWMQGRSVFGGLQTVIALSAMRGLVPEVPLRSLQTTFIQPGDDNTLTAKATILRSGKSAIHVESRLMNGNKIVAIVIGVFGSARDSVVRLAPEKPPVPSDNSKQVPYVEGLTPSFLQHFEGRWVKGGFPFSGAAEPENVIELSMPTEPSSTEFHIIALADYVPPIALSYMKRFAAGSSMTWMLEFLTDKVDGLPMQGWRVDSTMLAAADGYTSQSVTLWGPDDQPVAFSKQSMVVFG
ncbi:MAG: thioesterase family protein [Ketobacter sp.]|uniref:thioesterase family protein n=1 Tax=Ketobacter sp. MCCC 1A13808 TaxID=2602738 RepID=UPI0018DE5178|nr:thioesterase family protein [Ketobacter sp. MCCC 1A13808]